MIIRGTTHLVIGDSKVLHGRLKEQVFSQGQVRVQVVHL